MDRILNNEGILIFSILLTLKNEADYNIAKLYLCTILNVDKAIQRRMSSYYTYKSMVEKESQFEFALNRKFIEFQPVFLNALTMLVLTGLVETCNNHELNITKQGVIMLEDMSTQKNCILNKVTQTVNKNTILLKGIESKLLYNDLKIIL